MNINDDTLLIEKIDNLLDELTDKYIEDTNYLTKADIQLLLDVTQDYIKNENVKRDTQLIKISEFILNIKHNNDKISWFDIYDIVINPSLEYNSQNTSPETKENIETDDYNAIFQRNNIESVHTREFHDTTEKMFEFINSDQIDKIKDENTLNFDILNHTINLKKGLIYDNIEDRNHELEVQISKTINSLFDDLSCDDQIWVKKKLENWLKLYINAESTICNQNYDRSDIAKYMNET